MQSPPPIASSAPSTQDATQQRTTPKPTPPALQSGGAPGVTEETRQLVTKYLNIGNPPAQAGPVAPPQPPPGPTDVSGAAGSSSAAPGGAAIAPKPAPPDGGGVGQDSGIVKALPPAPPDAVVASASTVAPAPQAMDTYIAACRAVLQAHPRGTSPRTLVTATLRRFDTTNEGTVKLVIIRRIMSVFSAMIGRYNPQHQQALDAQVKVACDMLAAGGADTVNYTTFLDRLTAVQQELRAAWLAQNQKGVITI